MLTTQFNQALSNIEPTSADKDNAPKAHEQIREALKADSTISGWGFDPILIGSYKRQVSIRRVKDVDVFGRLSTVPPDLPPSEILSQFERVLKKAFPAIGDTPRVKRQARSYQVSFPEYDGLYVDAVPARPWTSPGGLNAWQLPTRDGEWQATHPEELNRLTTQMNDPEHHQGFYVPTVKLLRQTRRALVGKKRPGGLVVELAAYHASNRGLVSGSSQAEYYVTALEGITTVLREAFIYGLGLDDPTLPGEKIVVRADDTEKRNLVDKFAEAAAAARAAFDASDKCAAAKTFRDLLGKAEDDQGDQDYVFPMPDTCNLDGTAKRFTAVTVGDRGVPGGNRRFG
jgi:hypothetical protein